MARNADDARRLIPSVERLLQSPRVRRLLERYSRRFVLAELRRVVDETRQQVLRAGEARAAVVGRAVSSNAGSGQPPRGSEGVEEGIVDRLEARIAGAAAPRLRPVVNATGVALHTNLGRAVLAAEAVAQVAQAAASAVTLEYDLGRGARGERDEIVEADLVELTGAEAATVVNNNAAAVLLALNTLAEGREVVVSRGELIEIGGSFRIPEIMAKSGAMLREVGTTNRTHLRDYRAAIGPATALLLKVHTSNYRVVGFTADVSLDDLVALGRDAGLAVMVDLGSGALLDLGDYGLPQEPVVGAAVARGADLVTFSGDKLLGGPQAGIIVGKRVAIERLRASPLRRALRPGKLHLAALEATLRLYRQRPDLRTALPTLRWLTRPQGEMEAVGRAAAALLRECLGPGFDVRLVEAESEVGSGALPGARLPTRALAVRHAELSPDEVARRFRAADPPVIGRVSGGVFLLDLRGIFAPQELAVRFA